MLLEWKDDEEVIPEVLLLAAAKNPNFTLLALLDHGEAKTNIPEAVLVALAAKYRDSTYFIFFLERYKDRVEITEAVLVAAAGNLAYAYRHLEAILKLKPDTKLQVTENVLCAVARNRHTGIETLRFLYANEGRGVCFLDGAVTQTMLQAAAGNTGLGVQIMTLLLDRMEGHIHITLPVIEAARGNRTRGVKILNLLSERSDEALQICLLRQEYSDTGSKREELQTQEKALESLAM
jgi:hypothetical protein